MNNIRIAAVALLFLLAPPSQAQSSAAPSTGSNVTQYGPGPGNNYQAGMVPYQNQPGFGYYSPNPYAPGYPVYNAPAPLAGRYGGIGGSYWRAPSGYYYPWGSAYGYVPVVPPVVVVQQGNSAPAQPSISDTIKDMSTYLDEQNKKGKFNPDDYAHLNRRLNDLRVKQSMLSARNNGTLDSFDEENMRKDLSMLSGDISRRIRP